MTSIDHDQYRCVDCRMESPALVRETTQLAGRRISWSICVRCRARDWWKRFARLWLEIGARDRKGEVLDAARDSYRRAR